MSTRTLPRSLLLLLTLSLTACIATLPCATARKELPLNTAFPPVVRDAIRCDVCSFIAANALNQVAAKRDELRAKRLPLREDDILEETENMCIPFKDQGQWIRQVTVRLAPKQPADASAGHTVEVDVEKFYGRCGRSCTTVAGLCEEWMDREVMDEFPGQLLKLAKDANMTDMDHRDTVFRKFCFSSRYCKQHGKYLTALEKALRRDTDLLEELKAEKPERIKNEELEMETMMYRLTREQQQSAEVFSRDEIRKMQQAFKHGKKEDVAAVDPKAFDLSDEEFEELREHMFAEERGNGAGGRNVPRYADDDDL